MAFFPDPSSTDTQTAPVGRRQRRPHLLHEIQHELKTSLLSGLAVRRALGLKLLTYLAHYAVLFLVFFKLLRRKRLPVALQPLWELREDERVGKNSRAMERKGNQI